MVNSEHLEILKQGVKVWNQWRKDNPIVIAELGGADLNWANLFRALLSEADLSEADLSGADFSWADPNWANLLRAHLSRADFRLADLFRVDLSGADLSGADLSGADLDWANLSQASLFRANLSQASLFRANLSRAVLSRAELTRANLSQADLFRAELIAVNLKRANLSQANLSLAHLREVDLSEADLTGATMVETTLGDIDLRTVKGLESVQHLGPSSIGIDTVVRSGGNIPEVFLRGAGVPDNFITYTASQVGKAIEYYSCFIGYSGKDQDLAERLHSDLQNKGVRCWFAPEDLKIGDKFRIGIDESIRIHDKLLLILSEHSVVSDWVEQEVETALAKEREIGALVLFPIRLDETVMEIKTGWPALIKNTRHIGDFRQWKNQDKYQKAFQRLIGDLKAEA